MALQDSCKGLFTLTQKVFVIKSYYKGGESPEFVLNSLRSRFGRLYHDDNFEQIQKIVSSFEKTGSIQNEFYYRPANKAVSKEQPPDTHEEAVVEEEVIVYNEEDNKIHFVEIAQDMPEDDLIEEVTEEDSEDSSCQNDFKDKEEPYGYCTDCDMVYSSGLSKHLREFHKEKGFKCATCDQIMDTRRELYSHRQTHMPKTQYVCDICSKVSTSIGTHRNHLLVS